MILIADFTFALSFIPRLSINYETFAWFKNPSFYVINTYIVSRYSSIFTNLSLSSIMIPWLLISNSFASLALPLEVPLIELFLYVPRLPLKLFLMLPCKYGLSSSHILSRTLDRRSTLIYLLFS